MIQSTNKISTPNSKNIKVIQWNIRSFSKNHPSLLNFLHNNPVDIIALSETFKKPNHSFKLKGIRLSDRIVQMALAVLPLQFAKTLNL